MSTRPHIRPLRLVAAASLAVAVALLPACDRLPSPVSFSGVIQPRITPRGETAYVSYDRTFTFEGKQITLRVPVDTAVYEGATQAEKRALRFGKAAAEQDWVPDYYRAFIEEEHQEAFYGSMLEALHQVRDREKLDADRYAEMVLAMAQTITYRTDPVNLSPKFPIETFVQAEGDCDDKTLLAAGILARDGYDVSVLIFSAEKHVALGIAAPGIEYAGTPYAFAESTGLSIIGIPPEKLAGGIVLTSKPQVVRVGEGTLAYGAGTQVRYIRDRLQQVRADEQRLAEQIRGYDARLAEQKTSMEAKRPSGQPTREDVDAYNAEVRRFNALVAERNGVVRRHNGLVELEKFAADHQTDRVGLYAKLIASR